ncbi:MAG: hypothetical protein WAK48_31345 [Candidatus Acidiferrum sp.]|jgi:hypothetical protein
MAQNLSVVDFESWVRTHRRTTGFLWWRLCRDGAMSRWRDGAMAVEDLKLSPDKVDTIADFEAVKRFGVQSKGDADAATAVVLAELADLIARGELEVPIAGVCGLDERVCRY